MLVSSRFSIIVARQVTSGTSTKVIPFSITVVVDFDIIGGLATVIFVVVVAVGFAVVVVVVLGITVVVALVVVVAFIVVCSACVVALVVVALTGS